MEKSLNSSSDRNILNNVAGMIRKGASLAMIMTFLSTASSAKVDEYKNNEKKIPETFQMDENGKLVATQVNETNTAHFSTDVNLDGTPEDSLKIIQSKLPQLITNIENGMKTWDKEHGTFDYDAFMMVKKSLEGNPNRDLMLFIIFLGQCGDNKLIYMGDDLYALISKTCGLSDKNMSDILMSHGNISAGLKSDKINAETEKLKGETEKLKGETEKLKGETAELKEYNSQLKAVVGEISGTSKEK